MKNVFDIVIIGAGPAGIAASLFLNRQGYRVVVLDQARFPRDKVCGEFISPAADSILNELDVLKSIEAQSPLRLKGIYISAYEKEELWLDYPAMPGGLEMPTSLSVPRIVLDNLLVQKARESGIVLMEEHRVDDFIFENGSVIGVKGRDSSGTGLELKARMVVDAGGRNAISLRRLDLKRPGFSGGKVALSAHWAGANKVDDYCYMHVSPPGYTGTAKTAADQVNVVLVVDSFLLKGKDPRAAYLEIVLQNTLREKLLKGAEPIEAPRAAESLAFSVNSPSCGGLILVGDAMGFVDPFTGEGIYLALRSAKIAAEVIHLAFEASDFSRKRLIRYEMVRQQEFGKKILLSRILQKLIYQPNLCRKVVRLLMGNAGLARKLAGVIGDYIDPKEVVSFSFVFALLAEVLRSKAKANTFLKPDEMKIR